MARASPTKAADLAEEVLAGPAGAAIKVEMAAAAGPVAAEIKVETAVGPVDLAAVAIKVETAAAGLVGLAAVAIKVAMAAAATAAGLEAAVIKVETAADRRPHPLSALPYLATKPLRLS